MPQPHTSNQAYLYLDNPLYFVSDFFPHPSFPLHIHPSLYLLIATYILSSSFPSSPHPFLGTVWGL